jgi:hypothetical protein
MRRQLLIIDFQLFTEIPMPLGPIATSLGEEAGSQLISQIVNKYLAPLIESRLKKFRLAHIEKKGEIEEAFAEYFRRMQTKYSSIVTIVFQNQKKKLSEIYIPLTLSLEGVGNSTSYLIDDYPGDLLRSHPQVLITDAAGMGKSTLSRWILVNSILGQHAIPILVELRKLEKDKSIVEHLVGELSSLSEFIDADLLIHCISKGNFLFIFDGYDEIPAERKQHVSESLSDFVARAPRNKFILTSRPDSSLASFATFSRFKIQPLVLEEAFELIRRYDQYGPVSTELIEKITNPQMSSVHEFLKNPMLTSLLYRAFEYKQSVPYKKHVFYRQVFDALYDVHDLSKEGAFVRAKQSELDIENFHRVLRAFAFLTAVAGQVEFFRDEFVHFISRALSLCPGVSVVSSRLIDDLVMAVPLFVQDGPTYRWSHKSLQDYFAACFLWSDSNERKLEHLNKMTSTFNIQRYFNIIDIYADLDSVGFWKYILKDFMRRYRSHVSNFAQLTTHTASSKNIHYFSCFSFGIEGIILDGDVYRTHMGKNGKGFDQFEKVLKAASFPSSPSFLLSEAGINSITDKTHAIAASADLHIARLLARRQPNLICDSIELSSSKEYTGETPIRSNDYQSSRWSDSCYSAFVGLFSGKNPTPLDPEKVAAEEARLIAAEAAAENVIRLLPI